MKPITIGIAAAPEHLGWVVKQLQIDYPLVSLRRSNRTVLASPEVRVRFEELNTLGAASGSPEIFPCKFCIRVLLIIAFCQPFGFIKYCTMNKDYRRVSENDSDSHDYSDKFEQNESHRPYVGKLRSGKWSILLTLLNIVLFTISATVWGLAFTDRLPTNSQALQKVLYYCS